jgi:hypothetical protein
VLRQVERRAAKTSHTTPVTYTLSLGCEVKMEFPCTRVLRNGCLPNDWLTSGMPQA